MKLLRFLRDGKMEHGVLEGKAVYELRERITPPGRTPGALVGTLDELELLPPCEPSKIICAGHNYPWGENPSKSPEPKMFFKPPTTLIGSGGAVVYPSQSDRVIYEIELAVVIGKMARNVPAKQARDYILGYTCANDVTAYDLFLRDGNTFRAKSFDTFCPLGPVITTELDTKDLPIMCRINGETRLSGSTKGMYFSCEELLSFTSSIMTLYPGDLILTGTPDVGPLQRGDAVEIEIPGIGILRHTVV